MWLELNGRHTPGAAGALELPRPTGNQATRTPNLEEENLGEDMGTKSTPNLPTKNSPERTLKDIMSAAQQCNASLHSLTTQVHGPREDISLLGLDPPKSAGMDFSVKIPY